MSGTAIAMLVFFTVFVLFPLSIAQNTKVSGLQFPFTPDVLLIKVFFVQLLPEA